MSAFLAFFAFKYSYWGPHIINFYRPCRIQIGLGLNHVETMSFSYSIYTLQTKKTSVSFKKASWHTIPIWPNTHLFLSLTLFRPKYLYNSYYCFFTLLEALTLFFLYCNLIPNDFAGSKYFLTMGWKYLWRSILISFEEH